jgi:MbtH protein
MSKVNSALYAIVVNDEHHFSVWPTQRKLPPGWRYIGPTGTQAEMQELMQRQFVETTPAMHIAPETRFGDSHFAD